MIRCYLRALLQTEMEIESNLVIALHALTVSIVFYVHKHNSLQWAYTSLHLPLPVALPGCNHLKMNCNGINLSIHGYNDKLSVLFTKIIERMKEYNCFKDNFDRIKELVIINNYKIVEKAI